MKTADYEARMIYVELRSDDLALYASRPGQLNRLFALLMQNSLSDFRKSLDGQALLGSAHKHQRKALEALADELGIALVFRSYGAMLAETKSKDKWLSLRASDRLKEKNKDKSKGR